MRWYSLMFGSIVVVLLLILFSVVTVKAQGRWTYECFYTLGSAVEKLNSLGDSNSAKLAVYDDTSAVGHHCVVYRR